MHRGRPSFTLLPSESAGDNDFAEVQARGPSVNGILPPGTAKRPRRSSIASNLDVSQSSSQGPREEDKLSKGKQRKRHRRKGRQSEEELPTLGSELAVNGPEGVRQTAKDSRGPTPRSILDLPAEELLEGVDSPAQLEVHLENGKQTWFNDGPLPADSPHCDGEVTHALVPNKPRTSRELSIDLRTVAEQEEDTSTQQEPSCAQRTRGSDNEDQAVGQSSGLLQSMGDVRQRVAASPSEEGGFVLPSPNGPVDVTPVRNSSLSRMQSETRSSKLHRYGSSLNPVGGGADSTATTPRRGLDRPLSPLSPKWLEKNDQGEMLFPMDLSARDYLRSEVTGGSTLRNSAVSGGDERRERVYNTMFHVPWRVELLIDVGFLVCLESFLSLFTIMPYRLGVFLWRVTSRSGLKQRPRVDELCDLACMLVLAVGVMVLHSVDISFIYHWIRGQAIIKLYVVFNVLEIMDKLLQSFGADVLQVLFNTAGRVSICAPDRLPAETVRLMLDQGVATACYVLHSLIIMSQAVTLNVAINSHNNALLTLLISNNFAEIKSNVFKRLGRDNLHKLAYLDTVERFHIMAHLLFVLVQNVLTSEEPWAVDLALNAMMIVTCEVLVDVIKHAFLAKFNEVKPAVYGGFLQSLCWQTVQSGSHQVHKTLSFVPLAPACVVVRVVSPLLWRILPAGPRWLAFLLALLVCLCSIALLTVLRIGLGVALQLHARWYLNRCIRKGLAHPHQD